jgi:hypothetical protein
MVWTLAYAALNDDEGRAQIKGFAESTEDLYDKNNCLRAIARSESKAPMDYLEELKPIEVAYRKLCGKGISNVTEISISYLSLIDDKLFNRLENEKDPEGVVSVLVLLKSLILYSDIVGRKKIEPGVFRFLHDFEPGKFTKGLFKYLLECSDFQSFSEVLTEAQNGFDGAKKGDNSKHWEWSDNEFSKARNAANLINDSAQFWLFRTFKSGPLTNCAYLLAFCLDKHYRKISPELQEFIKPYLSTELMISTAEDRFNSLKNEVSQIVP